MPLGGSCLRSRLAVGLASASEVPLRWLRAFIVAEARGVAFGEDLFRHGFAVPPSPSGEGLESENPRGLPGGGLVIQRLLIALDSFVGISPQRSCGAW